MISVEECTEILNSGERKYTTEEVREVRDFVSKLAVIDYECFIKSNNST